MQTPSSRQKLPENQQKCPDDSGTENKSKQLNCWTRKWFLQAPREGMACWDAQAQRAIGAILLATFQTLKTYENANTVIQTRASGKPTEMPRCFRNKKCINTMKPLNTNGNGFKGSRTLEGMACWDAQAQRTIGTILFATVVPRSSGPPPGTILFSWKHVWFWNYRWAILVCNICVSFAQCL